LTGFNLLAFSLTGIRPTEVVSTPSFLSLLIRDWAVAISCRSLTLLAGGRPAIGNYLEQSYS